MPAETVSMPDTRDSACHATTGCHVTLFPKKQKICVPPVPVAALGRSAMFWSSGGLQQRDRNCRRRLRGGEGGRITRAASHQRLSRNGRNTTAATDRLPEACDRRGTA
jgi:hypothetical protein